MLEIKRFGDIDLAGNLNNADLWDYENLLPVVFRIYTAVLLQPK